MNTEILLASIKSTVPLSQTMKEGIDQIRDWARGRARPASSVKATVSVSGRRIEL